MIIGILYIKLSIPDEWACCNKEHCKLQTNKIVNLEITLNCIEFF